MLCASALTARQALGAAGRKLLGTRALQASAGRPSYDSEHVFLTEHEQGHILERLEDPAEVERVLQHLKTKSQFGDTMADTILRETVEARAADFKARMDAKGKKVLCEHGHEHEFCCGAKANEVEAGE